MHCKNHFRTEGPQILAFTTCKFETLGFFQRCLSVIRAFTWPKWGGLCKLNRVQSAFCGQSNGKQSWTVCSKFSWVEMFSFNHRNFKFNKDQIRLNVLFSPSLLPIASITGCSFSNFIIAPLMDPIRDQSLTFDTWKSFSLQIQVKSSEIYNYKNLALQNWQSSYRQGGSRWWWRRCRCRCLRICTELLHEVHH